MSDGFAHTRTLAELRAEDDGVFGGKSASLGELIAGGVPVPPGFALATSAFTACIEAAGLREHVDAALASVDPDDVDAAQATARELTAAVSGAHVPDEVRDEIARRYADLAAATGLDEPPVAVRSSALGEDSADAAFAGQQETYLWVRGADGIADAVRDCWASLYSAPALTYRARLGDAARDPAMGVTVQLMVDAEVSGVAFTCNPVSGDPSMIAINASWGLGLGVVGGDVTPDEYLVSKVTKEVVRRTIAPKTIEYRPAPGGTGTEVADVEPERADAPALDDERLRHLAGVARGIERSAGCQQDIEWAIARTGGFPDNLYVLQARPVTATGKGARPEGPKGVSAMSLIMSTFGADAGQKR
ncbi:PEP/pyruvate-binding domain-containing protein [Capillimicrobium parvum]|uniref:Phosphoenolpyruvate synthase n=1 Tax=Capillimicrobium parvum TaxID=2884022 RepID=A0A9E6XTD9_9ACTN|nr:PEP/pyruvate-binding domain-containing protein [Capillimicrobium parvum]UGS34224.1 Phosphoenolpyruvate synthase [Capillimicrobium parvum]